MMAESVYTHQTRVDDHAVHLNILDTAGEFEPETPGRMEQLKSADAFILVFSVTDRQSFTHLKSLINTLSKIKNDSEKSPTLVIGNKLDLCHLRTVFFEEGEALAKEFGGTYVELSACENVYPVVEAFHNVYREFFKMDKRAKAKRFSARIQLRQTIKNFTDKHLYHRHRTHTL